MKLIKCEYEDLPDLELLYNKRFGLEVIRDSVKYEFLIDLKINSDRLLIMSPSAIPDNSNHDRKRPMFQRWS